MGTPRRTDRGRQFAEVFGKVIRIARRKRGLKASSLAEDVGVRQQAVTAWERGYVLPSWEILFRLSTVLNIPMWMIIRSVERHLQMQEAWTIPVTSQNESLTIGKEHEPE